MSTRRAKDDWTRTPAGDAAYRKVRAEAQAAANSDGFDRGLERNDLFKSYNFFMLPERQNRYGARDLWCEVVHCEDIAKCRKGHGPR